MIDADSYYTEKDIEFLLKLKITLPPRPSCCSKWMERTRGTAKWHCVECSNELEIA